MEISYLKPYNTLWRGATILRKSQNIQTNVSKQERSQVTTSVHNIRTLGWELQLRSHGVLTPVRLSGVQGALCNSSSPGEDTTDEKWLPKCPGQCAGCADSDSLLCSVLELIISVSTQEVAKLTTQPLTPTRGQDTDPFSHGSEQVHTRHGNVSWPPTGVRNSVKRTQRQRELLSLLLEAVFLHGFAVWCSVHSENQSLHQTLLSTKHVMVTTTKQQGNTNKS